MLWKPEPSLHKIYRSNCVQYVLYVLFVLGMKPIMIQSKH